MNQSLDWIDMAFECVSDKLNYSYSPYSKFKVGSYVQTSSGEGFFGCNIENASYGATMCAERVAIYKAVSEGCNQLSGILIMADTSNPTPPCALCLQVMAEFCPPDFPVVLANLDKVLCKHRFKDLLTHPFGPSYILHEGLIK